MKSFLTLTTARSLGRLALAPLVLGALALPAAIMASPGAHKVEAEKAVGAAQQTAMTGGAKLSATLTGASEVPPADADGTGSFTATLNPGHDQLCYELKADKIDTASAAHIHAGAAGANGPPVVTLAAPANGVATACVPVAMDLAMKLMAHPEAYYVNVHNAAYPAGAIRGQLAK